MFKLQQEAPKKEYSSVSVRKALSGILNLDKYIKPVEKDNFYLHAIEIFVEGPRRRNDVKRIKIFYMNKKRKVKITWKSVDILLICVLHYFISSGIREDSANPIYTKITYEGKDYTYQNSSGVYLAVVTGSAKSIEFTYSNWIEVDNQSINFLFVSDNPNTSKNVMTFKDIYLMTKYLIYKYNTSSWIYKCY